MNQSLADHQPTLTNIQNQHKALVLQMSRPGEVNLELVQTFLETLAQAGATIEDAEDRSSLHELIRYWSNIINEKTGAFPVVQLQPFDALKHQQLTLPEHHTDWGEAPGRENFYGREQELVQLEQLIVGDRCRLIAVLGVGGIGKTALTAQVAERVKDQFEYFFWRSLQNAPNIGSLLKEYLQFISEEKGKDLPEDIDGQIAQIIAFIQEHRCLIVLDNVESILQGSQIAGQYREGYAEYGRLLQLLGEVTHQSCIFLTSREKPREVARLEGSTLPVRSLQLLGIGESEGRLILKDKGLFGSDEPWNSLIQRYSGNPLALQLVSESIREVFGGNVTTTAWRK